MIKFLQPIFQPRRVPVRDFNDGSFVRLGVVPILQSRHYSSGPSPQSGTSKTSEPPAANTVQPPNQKPKKDKIVIPNRINREPTAILKALASTVGQDYTAPHYRYHDDPYLIPMSNLSKRSYILSKESGKKAAKWIKQKHADLFMHKNAEPFIAAFSPNIVITDETPADEETVALLISQGRLADANKVYDMLKSKGAAISQATTQSLLEFVSFYNEAEPLDEDLIEERWFSSATKGRDRLRNTWKPNGVAERLFRELEKPDATAYCSLIRGRSKFYQVEKAIELLKEAQEKGLTIDTDTYNSILRVVCFARESSEMRWQLIEELTTEMERTGVRPNLATMNAILETLTNIGNIRQAKVTSLEVLSEFRNLGIEPCLASYYYLLMIFCKERGPVSTILVDIMKEIEGKEFVIQDVKDTFFFVTAMDICRNHLQDLELAKKIDSLLHTGNNYDLIGDSYKESIYYRHIFGLKATTEPFDTFMEYYNKLVPNVYTPEPGIMEEIMKALELNQSIQYLPQLWSDVVIFDQTHRESLIGMFLHIMASVYPSEDSKDAQNLRAEFVQIGWQIWTTLESQEAGLGKKIYWTGKMLGDLLGVTVRGGHYDKGCEVVKKLLRPKQDVVGAPEIQSLKLFLEEAIKEGDGAMGLACLQYVSEAGYGEINEMADDLSSKLPLDALQMSRLQNMIGFAKPDASSNDLGVEDNSETFTSSSGINPNDR